MTTHSSKGKRYLHVTLLSLILLLTACSSPGAGDPVALAAELDAAIPPAIAGSHAPSTQVAVVHQNQLLWSQAFGEGTSVEHVYMNASVQKMFTAVAVLQLVEQGLIDLDADVQTYLPFPVQHPGYLETPVTTRMLLAQRSGLLNVPHQFAWDTACAFSPQYRPCPGEAVLSLSLEAFLRESLTPGGSNYSPDSWGAEPGQEYFYSVSAYPLLRFLVSEVSGQSYEAYLRANIFAPLGMANSGFSVNESGGRHTVPYTRINGNNIELPIWDRNGSMMHTTAEDMARFMLTLMNAGQHAGGQLLQPETVALMEDRTSRFNVFLASSEDLLSTGFGLGLISFRGGWLGFGGSAPGYQCLLRYNPSRQVGYVILVNVNAILGGGDNYASAQSDIYAVQDALVSVLDPTLVLRYQFGEALIFPAAGLIWMSFMRRKARLLAALGGIWCVAGVILMERSASLGLGVLTLGVISLAWGVLALLKTRRASSDSQE